MMVCFSCFYTLPIVRCQRKQRINCIILAQKCSRSNTMKSQKQMLLAIKPILVKSQYTPLICSVAPFISLHMTEIIDFYLNPLQWHRSVCCVLFLLPHASKCPTLKSLRYSEAFPPSCAHNIRRLCLLHPLPGAEQSITTKPGYITLSAPAK